MAWNVNQIMDLLKFLMRTNQSGSLSSGNFFSAWNSEQSAYFQDLKGRFQARNNGKTGINTGLLEVETIELKLAPFTKTTTIAIAAGDGTKPTDFAYLLAFRINGKEVIHINKNQIATVNDDVIDPPSVTNNKYYYTPYEGFYSFLPNTVTQATIDYLSVPVDVVWAFTLDGNNRQVYDPANSVQPMWNNEDVIEITSRTLKRFGVSLKDGDFAAYGNSVQTTGN